MDVICEQKGKEQWKCILHVLPLHTHTPLSHWTLVTKYKFKGKIIKNVKLGTAEH